MQLHTLHHIHDGAAAINAVCVHQCVCVCMCGHMFFYLCEDQVELEALRSENILVLTVFKWLSQGFMVQVRIVGL